MNACRPGFCLNLNKSIAFLVAKSILIIHKRSTSSTKRQGRRSMALEKELATFQAHLSELVSTDAGKYALVHGEEITVRDSQDKAIDEGYDRYGLEQFLVKEI